MEEVTTEVTNKQSVLGIARIYIITGFIKTETRTSRSLLLSRVLTIFNQPDIRKLVLSAIAKQIDCVLLNANP